MDTFLLIFILVIFGIFMSFQDIKSRKVKNKLTFSFIFISFLIFLYSIILTFNFVLILIFLISTIIYFLISYKKILGAADSKILIGITLLILSIQNEILLFDFFINLFLVFTIFTFILCITNTSLKNKVDEIKNLPYLQILFQTLFALSVIIFLNRFLGSFIVDVLFKLSILIFLIILSSSIAKKLFVKLDENSKYVILFTLFSYSFYELFNYFLTSFAFLYLLKSLIIVFTNLSSKIEFSKKEYSAPLVPYLFFSVILTLILKGNLLVFLLL